MKKEKPFLFLVFLLFLAINLYGINFSDLNLSNDDRLLFKAEFESQSALFVSNLSNRSINQLTVFPEKMQIVENGRAIIASNRFGAARIQVSGSLPSPIPGYPSFAGGNIPLRGRLQELAASPDGRWVLYVEPTSAAHGNLLLVEIASGARRIVSVMVELPASDFPARWSPDSRLFVYSKGGNLFYFPILNDLSVLTDERLRFMGQGGINSISWGASGDFYYIHGNTIFRIINPELFTRTIYGDFLSIGSVAVSLPIEFNHSFDRFWIAPDSGAVLINKNGKGFYIYLLGEYQGASSSLPHTVLPAGTETFNVLWSPAGQLAIVSSAQNAISVWRFEIRGGQIRALTPRTAPFSANGILSPDRTKAAFWGVNGLEIWDFANWNPIQRLRNEPVFSCAWSGNERIISGNSRVIEEINISGGENRSRIICLSTVNEFGFEDSSGGSPRILARMGIDWYVTDGRQGWTSVYNPRKQQASLASDRYRVFLEPQPSGYFRNIPMIRNLQSTGTFPLTRNHTANRSYTPSNHAFQVALCFDLYDDDTGLYQVLASLRRYGIKATFFLNGDFIRRSPQGASAIAAAGHETASMFYAPIDFSDTRYRITRDFIARGLARNEDEFNQATGKELSLLWHPPYYRNNDLVNAAAAAAGYATVSRSIDIGDWLSRDNALRLNINYTTPSQMIEQIMERKTAGAVIPIRIGLLPGGRTEYLFQRIDVLLDALIRSNCEIIPVSAAIR
jgi:WD40 repeat protein